MTQRGEVYSPPAWTPLSVCPSFNHRHQHLLTREHSQIWGNTGEIVGL